MRFAMNKWARAVLSALALSMYGVAMPLTAVADEVATAAPAVDPAVFVEDLVSKLRELASDSDDADAERRDGLSAVLAEDMAIRTVQRFLLSREHRRGLSDDEVKLYNELFPRYISSAYADSIDQLVSRKIRIDEVVEGRRGDVIVRSKLLSDDGRERAGLDWRLRSRNGRTLLLDVMVDGSSFNVERRAQFSAIIRNDGFKALLDHMTEIADVAAS